MAVTSQATRASRPARVSSTAIPSPVTRIRVPLLVAALASTLLAAVLILYGFSQAADRTQVLRVTRDVAAGEIIPGDSLATIGVAVDATNQLVPADARESVAGHVATKPLLAGDLLSRSDLTAAPQPDDGELRVGAVLPPGRYPLDLRRGDAAIVSPTDGEIAAIGVRVLDIRPTDEGVEVVLAVPTADAATAAQLAAQNRLALIGEPRP
jgi:SAF domain